MGETWGEICAIAQYLGLARTAESASQLGAVACRVNKSKSAPPAYTGHVYHIKANQCTCPGVASRGNVQGQRTEIASRVQGQREAPASSASLAAWPEVREIGRTSRTTGATLAFVAISSALPFLSW